MGWLGRLFRRRRPVASTAAPPPVAAQPSSPVPAPATLTEVLRDRIDDLGGPIMELDPNAWGQLSTRITDLAEAVPPLSFPSVASQVLSLVTKHELDLNELVGLVQRDAAIASALLRIANSPVYAPSSPITSLRGAVGHVGVRGVVDIVVGIAGRSLYEVASRVDIALFPDMWQTMFDEAMANAFTAGRVALDHPHASSERALLAGLLSDIGRPIALRILATLIREGFERPSDAVILATLDETALRIGKRIVGAMSLPAELRDACVADDESPSADSQIARLVGAIGAIQRRSPRIWISATDVRDAAERLALQPLVVRSLFAQRTQYVMQARELFAARAA